MDLSGIEFALSGIHAGIASLTGADHWAISNDEARSMSKAIENVARHYPNIVSSQKLVDWAMLLQALGVVYGPRIAISAMNKPKKEAPKSAAVVPFQAGSMV